MFYKYINFHDFLRLKIADRNGSIRKNKYELNLIKDILKKKKEIEKQNSAFKIKDLKINGFEIMKIKNLTPGPEIGLILEKLLEIVIDNPELNNKEKLTQIVKEDNFNAWIFFKSLGNFRITIFLFLRLLVYMYFAYFTLSNNTYINSTSKK